MVGSITHRYILGLKMFANNKKKSYISLSGGLSSMPPLGYILIWQSCNFQGALAPNLSTPSLLWPLGLTAQDSSLGALPDTYFESAVSLRQSITLAPFYITPIVQAQTHRVWIKQDSNLASFDTSGANVIKLSLSVIYRFL
jgi:hypothetical protein